MEIQAQTMASMPRREPWNKGKLIGQKPPLRPKHVWSIRTRLQMEGRTRDLAMFNLAIDSELRACDLVRLQVHDICVSGQVRGRTTVIQRKTGQPVQFEISEPTGIDPRLAPQRRHTARAISVPEPFSGSAAPLHATVCAVVQAWVRERWAR